jgi:hypothetical protein
MGNKFYARCLIQNQWRRLTHSAIIPAFFLLSLFPITGWTAEVKDLTTMSLEDLMLVEVTDVSKKTEHLSDAPAVNGVINIITRKASETQGGIATAGAGT